MRTSNRLCFLTHTASNWPGIRSFFSLAFQIFDLLSANQSRSKFRSSRGSAVLVACGGCRSHACTLAQRPMCVAPFTTRHRRDVGSRGLKQLLKTWDVRVGVAEWMLTVAQSCDGSRASSEEFGCQAFECFESVFHSPTPQLNQFKAGSLRRKHSRSGLDRKSSMVNVPSLNGALPTA